MLDFRLQTTLMTLSTICATLASIDNFLSYSGCRNGWIFPEKAFLVVTAWSMLDCAAICSRTSGCYSFNTCPAGESVTCSLIAAFSTDGCGSLVPKPECKHRRHVNAADLKAANPCCNGGSYVGDVCVCIWGFAGPNCCRLIRSCREGYLLGVRQLGFYDIQPFGSPVAYNVYCNCNNGGLIWAFKRLVPPPPSCPPTNYNRTWEEYKNGFGDINCEYFLGLETMYILSTYASYQWNIYNVLADHASDASIQIENTVLKPEAQNYEVNFVRVFQAPWEKGGDAFDNSQKPRVFCTWDRDCSGCAKTVGGGWWFTSDCKGGALTAPQSQMLWPMEGADRIIEQAYLQMDLQGYY